jgi:hypothetical protein
MLLWVQPLPAGGWVEGDPQLFAEVFLFIKVWNLPPPIHPMAEVKERKYFVKMRIFCISDRENIFLGDALLRLRRINTIDHNHEEKSERTNDQHDIQTTINQFV